MDIKKNSAKAWFLAARPKTLAGAAVPVMIGTSLAFCDSANYLGDVFSIPAAVLCFLFAFIMQIDANFINDFFDYVRGIDDLSTRLGPERACSQGWIDINSMKYAIATTTCLACLVGLPLVLFGGLEMILVGIICVVGCFLYTTHLARLGLGDLLVLLFFGIIPVCITYYVQLHTVTAEVFVASVACGLVIDALLIVNNFRDRDTDAKAGKTTLAVRLGPQNTHLLYLSTGIAAILLGLAFLVNGHTLAAVLPVIYLVLHAVTWLRIKHTWQGRELNRHLGETARNIFIYGLTVSMGLLLS